MGSETFCLPKYDSDPKVKDPEWFIPDPDPNIKRKIQMYRYLHNVLQQNLKGKRKKYVLSLVAEFDVSDPDLKKLFRIRIRPGKMF